MHGKRPVSRGEAHSAYNSGGDEAPFTSGVPHHTPPDWLFSAPLLSHTHSRQEPGEGRRLRDGEMLIIRGRQPTRHIPPPKRHPRHPAAAHTGVLPSSTRLQRSEWAGQGFLSGQLSLSHHARTGTEKPGFSRQPQPTTG